MASILISESVPEKKVDCYEKPMLFIKRVFYLDVKHMKAHVVAEKHVDGMK